MRRLQGQLASPPFPFLARVRNSGFGPYTNSYAQRRYRGRVVLKGCNKATAALSPAPGAAAAPLAARASSASLAASAATRSATSWGRTLAFRSARSSLPAAYCLRLSAADISLDVTRR